jgi:hypothetical protein
VLMLAKELDYNSASNNKEIISKYFIVIAKYILKIRYNKYRVY